MSLSRPDSVREWTTLAGAVIGVVVAVWSGITSAVEYEQSLVREPELQAIINQQQAGMDSMKRDAIESRIFELDLIEKPTKAQRALRAYLQNKLDRMK